MRWGKQQQQEEIKYEQDHVEEEIVEVIERKPKSTNSFD